ncbi:MAG: hypothetical protein J6Q32_05510 [Clostridia bacterium]|nr:hypothetical protein [Clostridia bacterium]
MKIQDVDKNFIVGGVLNEEGIKYYTIPNENFNLKGVYFDQEENKFMRIPRKVAKACSDGVNFLCSNTTGGRVRFSTNSKRFIIKVRYKVFTIMPHFALAGSTGCSLLIDDGDKPVLCKMLTPYPDNKNGYAIGIDLDGKMHNYTLYMPLYNDVESLEIGLEEGAELGLGKPYKNVKPIVYYGSSITQGGCASRPDSCYQGIICKKNNVDFINLGFSGNAKGEDAIAEYIANLDCSLFVYDYDHNAPTIEHLIATHEKMFKTFREKNKNVPVIIISKPNDNNGKIDMIRKRIIRKTYLNAKNSGDDNVYFIDGATLYKYNKDFTVDSCHPTDLGFYFMAKRIYKEMCKIDEKFK